MQAGFSRGERHTMTTINAAPGSRERAHSLEGTAEVAGLRLGKVGHSSPSTQPLPYPEPHINA